MAAISAVITLYRSSQVIESFRSRISFRGEFSTWNGLLVGGTEAFSSMTSAYIISVIQIFQVRERGPYNAPDHVLRSVVRRMIQSTSRLKSTAGIT